VRLKAPVTSSGAKAFARRLAALGGRIELAAETGTFIVSLDDSLVDEIRRMEMIAVIGGITVGGRYPKRIMVRQGDR